MRLRKINKLEGLELAASIIKNLGLDPIILNQFPSELSGGMQKRVAIARAICDNPKILLFDEPTSGLDPITGSLIDNLIKKTVKKLGVSTITITHDISSVFKYANRVILINNNKIEWEGKPSEMKASNNQTIKDFLYSNKKN
jgi:ABC-type transport system involved in resistance to organic solvents, ATPase component